MLTIEYKCVIIIYGAEKHTELQKIDYYRKEV